MKQILIATDQPGDVETIKSLYANEFEIRQVQDRDAFVAALRRHHPEMAFIDIRVVLDGQPSLPQKVHYQLQEAFWEASSTVPVIILAPPELLREAVKAVKAGASTYLTSPVDPLEVSYITESQEEWEHVQMELDYLRGHFWKVEHMDLVQTRSPLMREVFDKIQMAAPTNTTVLLTGETGVGKSTLAKLIHHHSKRADKPFVSVHCGAIPDNLLESELFGHEKGAFTGALRRKRGKFEIADLGTIFLDEVGVLTPAAQIKLLGVIQEKFFQRVGGENDIRVDTRIIAATNIDLKSLCDQGSFRTDLYYRLNVFPLEVPPLRERKEDVPILVRYFARKMQKEQTKVVEDVDPRVMEALVGYAWPGNVRELENLIERAFILESSRILTPKSFPAELFGPPKQAVAPTAVDTSLTIAELRRQRIDTLERQYLEALLREHNGRIRESAQAAGVGVRNFHKLLTKHGISKGRFK
jgi:DNA-binding NtrC family response regulator